LELTDGAERAGADALLVVTPYYVRPPQSGLVEYFTAVGGRTGLPLLVYNIPGRTGVAIGVDALVRIAERVPGLVGVKHAAPDLDFVTEVLRSLGTEFRVFCGLEALSLPMLAVGARGVMNAVANLVPERVAELCDAASRGDLAQARRLHGELFELSGAIFFDTNPIPLKWMMQRLGLIARADVRLPLVAASADVQARCEGVLGRAGLLAEAAGVAAAERR
ncbi:MAG: dihydrodipicolinate synthase family protein, partial [Candidatus Binatia bacterium]